MSLLFPLMRSCFCSLHLFIFFLNKKSSDLDCFFKLGKEIGEKKKVSYPLYFGIEISTMIFKVMNVAPSRHVKKAQSSPKLPFIAASIFAFSLGEGS